MGGIWSWASLSKTLVSIYRSFTQSGMEGVREQTDGHLCCMTMSYLCEEHNMSHWHLMGINFVSTSSNSKYFQLLFSNFKTIIGKGYCIACNTKFPRTNYTAMEELRILTFSSDAINCRAFPKESGRKTKTKNRYGTRRFSLSYLDTLLGPYSVQGLGKS